MPRLSSEILSKISESINELMDEESDKVYGSNDPIGIDDYSNRIYGCEDNSIICFCCVGKDRCSHYTFKSSEI